MIVFGIGSGILSLFDYEIEMLMWIDNWGDGVAWFIRSALILVGLALMSTAQKGEQAAQPQQQMAPPQDLVR